MRTNLFDRLPTIALAAFLAGLPACGSDTTAPQAAVTPPVTKDPPAWTDAPSAVIAMGQGQTKTLPLMLKGAGAAATATSATDDLEVEIATDPSALSLHAGYAASGPASLEVDVKSPD